MVNLNNKSRFANNLDGLDRSDFICSKEEISFVKGVASHFELEDYHVEFILHILKDVWPDRKILFGTNTPYENIILGILLSLPEITRSFITEEGHLNLIYKIDDYIIKMQPIKYKMNKISIYNINQILVDLFPDGFQKKVSFIEDIYETYSISYTEHEDLIFEIEKDLSHKHKSLNKINVDIAILCYIAQLNGIEIDEIELEELIQVFHGNKSPEHLTEVLMILDMTQGILNYKY